MSGQDAAYLVDCFMLRNYSTSILGADQLACRHVHEIDQV